MISEKMLWQYARLVVEVGVNLQKGQRLLMNTPVDCAGFARLCVKAAYEAGARDVIVQWNDDFCSREHWLHADESAFEAVAPWDVLRNQLLSEEGAGYLAISATDPELLCDVDPERVRRWDIAVGRDHAAYYERMMASRFPWCVASAPVASWAKKVFPDLPEEEAMESLWKQIFAAVRITEDGDAVAEWRAHCSRLADRAAVLNALQLTSLHYSNALGTDLTVGLPEGHVWQAGDEAATSGVRFVANMPTEEIFTAPRRDAVDGVLCASMPLVLNGTLVEGIRLTFQNGRICEVHAEKGEPMLRAAIETDEGAHYLGEAALVPYDSPIRRSGLLFYNTLFDENAACHFAFGEAYPSCLEGGQSMTKEELLSAGVNAVSAAHVDFMVGTKDLSIIGTTKDGREVPVFCDGQFAI